MKTFSQFNEHDRGDKDKAAMHKLTGQAMKAIPGSPKQKGLIKQLNILRKLNGMKAISEADGCWDGFKKVGMKKKGDKMVPNCVPESVTEARMKYNKVIKKLKDGEWDTSMDVKKRNHLTYTDNKSGKKKVVFVENDDLEEAVKYMNMNQLKKELKKEYGAKASSLKIVKIKGGVSIQTPGGQELERYNNVPKLGFTVSEGKGPPESFEAQFKRRVVATTKPEHKEKGYKWRIKGKDRPNISIKLYKSKPDFAEFKKQLKRVAGHEFG